MPKILVPGAISTIIVYIKKKNSINMTATK